MDYNIEGMTVRVVGWMKGGMSVKCVPYIQFIRSSEDLSLLYTKGRDSCLRRNDGEGGGMDERRNVS